MFMDLAFFLAAMGRERGDVYAVIDTLYFTSLPEWLKNNDDEPYEQEERETNRDVFRPALREKMREYLEAAKTQMTEINPEP